MADNSLVRGQNHIFQVEKSTVPYLCLYALLYAALTLSAYFLPTGEFLLRPGAALLVLAGAIHGPLVGFGAGLLGGFIADLAQNMVWLHWDLGLGVMGGFCGLYCYWVGVEEEQRLTLKATGKLMLLAVVGSFSGMFLAGLVDLLLGAPPLIAFYAWALPAALVNAFFGAIFGPLLFAGWLWMGRINAQVGNF